MTAGKGGGVGLLPQVFEGHGSDRVEECKGQAGE